jgi:glycosyltransferase involved in cell wall biosynthesis
VTAITVVIATHNQAERLRLVLCGLSVQTMPDDRFEVIVVDDGCTDGTVSLLATASYPWLRVVPTPGHVGRCAARNQGLAAARGELVVFLDGDALPMPELVATYWEAYQRQGGKAVFCGLQHVLADLDYLRDPQDAASVVADAPSVVADWVADHAEQVLVRATEVLAGSRTLWARSQPGGYPFPDSAERQRQARQLLARDPEPGGLRWLGFVPHNGAVARDLLNAAGGFDADIPFSEGWELAYRLQNHHGASVYAADAASIHLYHHHPFADPEGARAEALVRYRAIEYMVRKHRDEGIRLLYLWFAALWPDPFVPEDAVLPDLVRCDAAYQSRRLGGSPEDLVICANHPVYGHLAAA